MNTTPVRRLVTGGLRAAAVVGTLAAIFHCGGGERPAGENIAPTITTKDAGTVTGSGVTFPDVDIEKGVLFGDQGMVDCGKQAGDKTITLKNTTADIINITAAITVGSNYYKVTPDKAPIPSGGTLDVKISPTPIPAESDVTEDLYAGTLEIKYPDRGAPPTDIRLHQTARGAIITTTTPNPLPLGAVKVGAQNTASLSLSNGGNMPINATFTVGTSVYTVDGGQTVTKALAANGSAAVEVKLSPVTSGTLSDTIAIAYNASAVMCKAPPTSVALTGSGTTSVGISQGVLDFGLVNCNTTAGPQTIDITSTIAMKFTPVLTKGGLSPYSMANGTTGDPVAQEAQIDVPAASTFKLKIIPKAIDPVSSTTDNAFGDTLTITTDVPGDSPHAIQLRETAKGAILKFDQATISVSGPVGTNILTNFSLINSGNAQVPYVITASPAPNGSAGGFSSNLTSGNIVAGGSVAGVLTSQAPTTKGQTTNGSLSVALGAAGGVLCADLPPATPLAVTGTGSAITVNPTNLPFGLVNCGTTAAPQSIVISSTVSTNITVKLNQGAGSSFSLAQDSANTMPIALNSAVAVTPGNPYTLWVIPKQIPVPSSTDPNKFGDTLTLTSDIATEDVKQVLLTMTAQGAIYSAPATVNASKTTAVPFSVTNTGNANGSFTLDSTTPINGSGGSLTAGASLGFSVPAGSPGGTVTINPSPSLAYCGNSGTIVISPSP